MEALDDADDSDRTWPFCRSSVHGVRLLEDAELPMLPVSSGSPPSTGTCSTDLWITSYPFDGGGLMDNKVTGDRCDGWSSGWIEMMVRNLGTVDRVSAWLPAAAWTLPLFVTSNPPLRPLPVTAPRILVTGNWCFNDKTDTLQQQDASIPYNNVI